MIVGFCISLALQGAEDPAARLALAGVPVEERAAALAVLAEKNKSTPLQELLAAIGRADPLYVPALPDLGAMLAAWDPLELEKIKPDLEKLSKDAVSRTTRRAALAAWIIAENDVNRPWLRAEKDRSAMIDVMTAIGELPDEYLRRASFGLVRTMMFASTRELSTPEGLKPALRISIYEHSPAGAGLEGFVPLKPVSTATVRQIGGKLSIPPRAERPGVVFSGVVRLPEDGKYGFALTGEDTARLYIDGVLRASRPAFGGAGAEALLELVGGAHSIEVTCLGGASLGLAWTVSGGIREPVPAAAFDDPQNVSVRETAIRVVKRLPGAEEAKVVDLLQLMRQEGFRDALGDVMATIPEEHWTRDQARGTVGEVLAHAARNARGAGPRPAAYRHAVTLARILAKRLEGDDRDAALRTLVELETFDALPLGRRVYLRTCTRCHQAGGAGWVPVFPPLALSEWVDADGDRSIKIVLNGLTGGISVREQGYIAKMEGLGGLLDDAEVAAVVNYVGGAWGNKGATVTAKDVARVRADSASRSGRLWEESVLLKGHPLK